jgi:hypothetical protein
MQSAPALRLELLFHTADVLLLLDQGNALNCFYKVVVLGFRPEVKEQLVPPNGKPSFWRYYSQ